ncbi:fimbrial biogenesis chaperone [[Pseudomonas] boreopolis]|uniref:fimbrial biogenesis chaperone n=1 Tax=Xanthomonas boreopolis TaxID=86183 RepID=UPI003DA0874A
MRNLNRNLLVGALASLALMGLGSAQAAVTMVGTRVVFPAEANEVNVRLHNVGETPSLVQAWIDDGDASATPSTSKAPFIVRPPIFRIDGEKSQVIRIARAGGDLPEDRESLFGFNVLDMPAQVPKRADGEGATLKLVVRTRVKMFYRPKGLTRAAAAKAPAQLQWKIVDEAGGHALRIDNPTPYHVILKKVASAGIDDEVIAPLSSRAYRLGQQQYQALRDSITFEYAVTDTGVAISAQAPLARP